MILRIVKAAAIAALSWFSLPWLTELLPHIIIEHWESGRTHWAVLETLSICLQTLFLVSVVSNMWKFGERQSNGERQFEVHHKKLLKYSGLPLLFVLLLSELGWRSQLKGNEQRTKLAFAAAVLLLPATAVLGLRGKKDNKTVYGLQHGRLHLDAHIPMWMNMGYWKVNEADPSRPKILAEACRDLLNLVLAEAGLPKEKAFSHSRCLVDVGFGCGEQTIHLMSEKPIRPYDKLWWDNENHQVYFDHYIGITQDKAQHQYAQKRVEEMKTDKVNVFRADASKPWLWSEDLHRTTRAAESVTQETWLLALDTAYHFSPSRWVLIHHMWRDYAASVMAFDLCLSPTATISQKIVLRILTTLMGAPWANFETPDAYRQKLIGLGYPADGITIVDISDHVFAPLAEFMDGQDRRLKTLGLGLGSFHAAKWLFDWWGRTGLVRGVVVIAKHEKLQESLRVSVLKA